MQNNELPGQIILFKSANPEQHAIKNYLNEWQIKFIEAEYFAQIQNHDFIKQCSCALAIIEDQKGVEFLRSIMQYFSWTQRIMLSTRPEVKLLEAAINRAHINYFLPLPVSKQVLHTYLIKANRRFKNLITPLSKFEALSDVTIDLLEVNQRFKDEAEKDALTGLLNRRSFDIYLGNLWQSSVKKKKHFSLAMLDIDYFKKVNDRYGHPVGDEVLKQFGQLLLSNQRTSQDFAFRVGGEEFALLSIDLTKENMARYVQRILNLTRKLTVSAGNAKIRFTFSAGVADVSQAKDVHDLINKADQALYKAKNSGRNTIKIFSINS
ncbi:MAG: diguanylate cyclase [Caldisericaceae bacterium]|nr:diguanylate cyclase [Caldisericaceae bacterium]